jgi:hypothetical protein
VRGLGEGTETYHGFVAEFLDEAVEDHGERLGCDAGAGQLLGVAIHACLPVAAHGFADGNTVITAVLAVLLCAKGNLDPNFRGVLARLNVDIIHDAAPGAVNNVHEQTAEERVDGKLHVEGEDRGQVGVRLNPRQEATDACES